MIIYGEYNSKRLGVPSPYVEGFVSFTRLGIQDWVNFLVDSGADGVALNIYDVRRMGIPQNLLRQAGRLRESVGIGGTQRYYSVAGTLAFEIAPDSYIRCYLDINIAGDDANAPVGIPSLLGRDFLNLCDVRLNYSTGLVALEPVNVNEYGEIPLL